MEVDEQMKDGGGGHCLTKARFGFHRRGKRARVCCYAWPPLPVWTSNGTGGGGGGGEDTKRRRRRRRRTRVWVGVGG